MYICPKVYLYLYSCHRLTSSCLFSVLLHLHYSAAYFHFHLHMSLTDLPGCVHLPLTAHDLSLHKLERHTPLKQRQKSKVSERVMKKNENCFLKENNTISGRWCRQTFKTNQMPIIQLNDLSFVGFHKWIQSCFNLKPSYMAFHCG